LKYIFNIVFYSLFYYCFFFRLYHCQKYHKFFASIFFKQMRKNLNGGDFVYYEFRSMKVNDVADSKQAMLMVLVKQNLGIYFFVLVLILP